MNSIVIALFAMVAVAQATTLLPLSANWVGAPSVVSVNDGLLGLTAPGLVGAPVATPWAVAAPLAAPAVVAAVPAASEYVAANRGSVHVAPLPGHLVGSQQLNLSPAPGTL